MAFVQHKLDPWTAKDPNLAGHDLSTPYQANVEPTEGTFCFDRPEKDVYLAMKTPQDPGGSPGVLQ
jgi:hypothetical protein